MIIRMLAYGTLIVFLYFGVVVNASCEIDKSVKNVTDWNHQVNELKMLSSIFGKRSKELVDVNGNKYQFVVCDEVDAAKPQAGLIQISGDKTVVLGLNNRTVVSSKSNWLMLTLMGGDKYNNTCGNVSREAHVMFICNPLANEIEMHTVTNMDINTSCYFLFVVEHKSVCSGGLHPGLTGGSILLILIFVAFLVYFVFGFFYLRLVRGAKGVEQIPNRSFWFKVGNMCADGCGAVCRCDQYCGGGGVGQASSSYDGYSPIDEQMAQDLQNTDRDSALLSP